MLEDDTPVVLHGVTKRFGAVTAVREVSWAPRRGQVTALVGLNGAGKSTLVLDALALALFLRRDITA